MEGGKKGRESICTESQRNALSAAPDRTPRATAASERLTSLCVITSRYAALRHHVTSPCVTLRNVTSRRRAVPPPPPSSLKPRPRTRGAERKLPKCRGGMDALRSAGRALLRSPSVTKPPWAGGRHQKLPENWTDTRETLLEGVLFSLKYLGMTLVEQPKGEELSAAAVKRIVATAKASGKKLQKVTLKVSPRGIVLNDSGTNELIENVSIYRISYCTADKIHDKVFAYIAQNQLNENLECHAFLCTKRKMAQAVTLTVAQAFKIAFEFWQASKEEKEKRERSILEGEGVSSPNSAAPACPDASAATGNLLDLEDPAKLLLTSSENPTHLDNSMFGPSSSVNNNLVWTCSVKNKPLCSRHRTDGSRHPECRNALICRLE
ncbi:low density lipoprotein receptor adapter protein 1 isoform X2 [Phasianus colchicus]|uniref:low density lipoprotein receptor adapter protein 1 isoform X2 n=1 Tax=Phasianus colchicus TaxID=9054 RepID=UPI00129DFEB0|nr:low density lipoprotein receptor adapter protein 1 isoform X2 [Phasianus colchicus]